MLLITYSRDAQKALRKIPGKQKLRILTAIEKVAEDPARSDLDIKKLQGRPGCRLRVGDYRVIYSEDGVILDIEDIGPRGSIYR
jgi:mRNA interferase RelE/StbE